eukprot:NODE_4690_length_1030_cov_81.291069_g4486_i0.p1 GENE.NODE_4690_length_1030_cov_81.291069_g4486_i0~~NODE_4690_length_1030_cov_81.291069_g4486_i0.p1  ORF type:complete len:300 (-),score=49.45 NODE_4690_length_1030_cov_81.291069_g4486_i0:26-925(-)
MSRIAQPWATKSAAAAAVADVVMPDSSNRPTSEPSVTHNGQRMEVIEFLVKKRTQSFEYFKHAMDGNVLWLETFRFSSELLSQHFANNAPTGHEKRVQQWFYLGFSMAPLLNIANGPGFLAALEKLIQEWEYLCSNAMMQSVKLVTAFASKGIGLVGAKTGLVKPGAAADQQIDAVHGRAQSSSETLLVPPIPFPLDFYEVVYSLMEMLIFTYRKLIDETSSQVAPYNQILAIDSRVKHVILTPLSKELSAIGAACIKKQREDLDTIFGAALAPAVAAAPIAPSPHDEEQRHSATNAAV